MLNLGLKTFSSLVVLLFLSATQLGATQKQPLDLRILVDISGEVATAQPRQSHLDALHLLLEKLPDSSRVGIWTYGKYVNYLVQQKSLDSAWREHTLNQIRTIKAVAANRNISAVLKKASYDSQSETDSNRSLLLFSAGDLLVSDNSRQNEQAREAVLRDLLPKLRRAGYTIHTVALSAQADNRLLRSLAKETGGFSFVLHAPDDIYAVLDLFAQWLNPQNSTPIEAGQFAIEAGIKRFTALLRHPSEQQVSIRSPNGKTISASSTNPAINWVQGRGFALVEVTDPELGQWRVSERIDPQSRIYIDGVPTLEAEGIEDSYIAGENLSLRVKLANLDDDNSPLVSVNLIGEQQHSYDLEQSSFSNSEYIGEVNGFYQAGVYRALIKADSLGYTRFLELPFQVNELLKIEVSKQRNGEEHNSRYQITIRPVDKDLNLNQSTIVATIVDDSGDWRVSSVNLNRSNDWELFLEEGGDSDEYQIKLDFKGVTLSGREIHFQPKPLVIESPRPPVAEITTPAATVLGPETEVAGAVTVADDNQRPESRPLWLIILALVSIALALVLLAFYFIQVRRKAAYSESAQGKNRQDPPVVAKTVPTVTPETTPPDHTPSGSTSSDSTQNMAAIDSEQESVSDTDEGEDEQEQIAEAQELAIEIDFSQLEKEAPSADVPVETAVVTTPGSSSTVATQMLSKPAEEIDEVEQPLSDELEAELTFDSQPAPQEKSAEADTEADQEQIDEEGTELAAEWSALDLESDVEPPATDFETEKAFDFDQDDDDKDPDRTG